MLTAKQFAERKSVSLRTVRAWLADGKIPNVKKEETLRGPVLLIPESSLNAIEKGTPGPKPKLETMEKKGSKKTA